MSIAAIIFLAFQLVPNTQETQRVWVMHLSTFGAPDYIEYNETRGIFSEHYETTDTVLAANLNVKKLDEMSCEIIKAALSARAIHGSDLSMAFLRLYTDQCHRRLRDANGYWISRDGRRIGLDCNPCREEPEPGYKAPAIQSGKWKSMCGDCTPSKATHDIIREPRVNSGHMAVGK